jgi:hypothetical protein
VFVKPCLLELVVNIGGDDKIVLVFNKLIQAFVCAVVYVHVAVDVNIPSEVLRENGEVL